MNSATSRLTHSIGFAMSICLLLIGFGGQVSAQSFWQTVL